ncbi:putative ATP-dependent RNA helicase TDRD12 isoform X2 [Anabrus simplex]|uniref:putative ATP-dependent RNA helicase TDRD12 isoform X2 n=1 Tax=Anabrus simplex TaxID=316456 RepID=UPI0035A312AD
MIKEMVKSDSDIDSLSSESSLKSTENSVPRRNDLLELLNSLKKSDSSSSRSSNLGEEIVSATAKPTGTNQVKSSLLDLLLQDKKAKLHSDQDDIKNSSDTKCDFVNGFAQTELVKEQLEKSEAELQQSLCKVTVKQECESPLSQKSPKQECLKYNSQSQNNISFIPAGASLNTVNIPFSNGQCASKQNETEIYFSPLADSKSRQFTVDRSQATREVFRNSARYVRSLSVEAGTRSDSSKVVSPKQKSQETSSPSTANTRQFKLLNELLKLSEFQLKQNSTNKKEAPPGAESIISDNDDSNSVKSCEPEPVALSAFEDIGIYEKPSCLRVADHLRINPVLVHGEGKCVKPIVSIAQACFPGEIHKALFRCGFNDPMRIQKYVWPLILRGGNVVMVSPPRSGKTLAYMAPLVGFMLQKDSYIDLPKGCGPLILILCSSSSSAQNVYDACSEIIVEHKEDISVLVTYGGGAEQEQMVHLLNGCDILISTPRCLLRLLEYDGSITNLKRVAHLVFDEADILSLKYLPEMKEVLTRCSAVLKKRKGKASRMQIVAASQKWCPALESLARVIPKSPTICISSCLEAAVYARLQPHLHFVDDANRTSIVKDILKNQMGLYKTVVVCHSSAEVEDLALLLEPVCDNIIVAHGNMSHIKKQEVFRKWNHSVPGRHPVLVCSDSVLYDVKLQDALWLIHYSLPSDSKTVFGFRFSCLMDNFRDLINTGGNKAETLDCSVHILLDENSTHQLPSIIHLMKRLGASISKNLEEASAEAEKKKELKKGDVPLCYNIRAFGDCWDKSTCPNRHMIKIDSDSPRENFPVNGIVKLKVLHIHDACNMSARLLEHTDLEGKTKSIPDQFISICFKLNSYYKNISNRILHGIPKMKDICAVECGFNVFQRAQVLSTSKINANGEPEEVLVQYLDHGKWEEVKIIKLLALPEDLQKLPPQVVEIFICRLSPCDLDWNWGRAVTLKVSSWLKEVNSVGEIEGKYIQGQIVLSLNNTLWLDPLECRRALPMVGTSSLVFSVRSDLLKANLAVDNPHHINNLHKLCVKAGLTLPPHRREPTSAPAPLHNSSTEVQWAFLPGEELDDVYLCTAENPSVFFVRLAKWEESLEKLKQELQKVTEKDEISNVVLQPGAFCLGRFPIDGLWYRAQVLNVQEDAVDLFFVDYGDKATVQKADISSIPESYLTRLPFQAIECALIGVKPMEGDSWKEEATDVLYDATADSDEEFVKLLNVKVCKKVKPALFTGGFRYSVILWDGTDNSNVVNQLLVDRGLAAVEDKEAYALEMLKEFVEKVKLPETERESGKDSCDLNESFTSTESGVSSEKSPPKIDSSYVDSEIEVNSEMELCKLDNSCTELALPDPANPENMQVATLKNGVALSGDIDVATKFIESCEVCDAEDLMLFFNGLQLQFSKQKTMNKKKDSRVSSVPVEPPSNLDTTPAPENVPEPHDHIIEDALPILKSTTRQPKVLWSEDNLSVTIKVMLIGVEQYYIYCDVESITFSTEHNGEVYLVDLDLFGVVDYRTVQHAARGQYVFIRLEKLVKGFSWSCLIRGSKPLWLNYDMDAKEHEGNMERLIALQNRSIARGPAELSDEEDKELDEEEEDDGLAADIVDSGDEMFDINDPLS